MSEVKKETKTKKASKPKETKVKKEVKLKEEKKETKSVKKVTEKKTRVKKENLEIKEKALLNDNDQVKCKALCKVVKILSKIGKIFLMILVPFIFLAMIFIPILFKNFEVEANIVKFDDLTVIVSDDEITFKMANDIHSVKVNPADAERIITVLTDNSKSSIITYIELSLLLVAIVMILNIYLLNYIEKLFANFTAKETPFIKENAIYILRIAIVLSVIKFITICLSTAELNNFNFQSLSILSILIIYAIYFIFKYAVKMQEQNNYKIYD